MCKYCSFSRVVKGKIKEKMKILDMTAKELRSANTTAS